MLIKSFVAVAALAVPASIASAGAAGAAGPTDVIHFRGRAGSAILTDCPPSPPLGTECRAVDVFAAEERLQENTTMTARPVVAVILYDVVIDGAPPFGFTATAVGQGESEDVDVSIARNLSSGRASAEDVEIAHCDETGCSVVTTVDVTAEWTATGPRVQSSFHAGQRNPFFFENFHATDDARPAEASGTLDGDPVVDTTLFPSELFASTRTDVFRAQDLALRATGAVTAAVAAAIHASGSSALAIVDNCPSEPTPGTCRGAFINATASTVGRGAHEGTADAFASADLFAVTVHPDGTVDVVLTGFGFAEDPDLVIDDALAAASLSATLDTFACDQEFNCEPAGPADLDVSWTGVGDVFRSRQHFQNHDAEGRDNFLEFGRSRDATAAAELDGAGLDGPGELAVFTSHGE
jgi:hypothetical protein